MEQPNKLQDDGIFGLKEEEGGSSTCGAAPNCCTVVELQQRAADMFTTGECVVQASGKPPVGAATNSLMYFASQAIHTLFEQRRTDVQRGCGSLNKEVALGFLVADALGRRLLSDEQAREVGKRAGKQVATLKARIERIKERARGKRSAARKAAKKDASLEARLVVRVAEIDTEAATAHSELLEQPYNVGLPDEDVEMKESSCDASPEAMLAKAKAALIVAEAAVQPAEAALAVARRKAMRAMDGLENTLSMLKSDGATCSDARYKQLKALVDEYERLQADFISEAEAAEGVRDATYERVGLLYAELRATERALAESFAERERADEFRRQLENNECALARAQKIAGGLQEIVEGKQGTIDALERAIHALEIRDTRNRLEADAESVWGAGWRGR